MQSPPSLLAHYTQALGALRQSVSKFPWKSALLTLRKRFREDHLGLTASSLTFTTIIALVPLVTVALAVFTAFPMFAKFQDILQKWLIESLIPDNIARQVLGYLTQFAGKASKLGLAGLAILLGTALALMFTIDGTLNAIWRVRKHRPLGQRVLVYWTAMTLGPLVLGVSLTVTSYALSASKGVVNVMPSHVQWLLDSLQVLLMAAGMAAIYRYVPNTQVKWSHAWTGGFFVALGLELAKKLLALYLSTVPTYSMVYGAFATLPILLIWIYIAWVIVLLGAVITAYLPSLLAGPERRERSHGLQFQVALEVLQRLNQERANSTRGLTMSALCAQLHIDALQLEPALESLRELDWVGLLEDAFDLEEPRYILLANPDTTPLAPLLNALLLPQAAATENLRKNSLWTQATVRQAL